MSAGERQDCPYYAKDGRVWKSPVQRKNDDGSTTISIGFPVCRMDEAVGDGAAETVAYLMNRGADRDPQFEEMVTLLRDLRLFAESMKAFGVNNCERVIARIDGAIAKLEASNG